MLSVRLGVSMSRDERREMTVRYGRSHAVRVSTSMGPWSACECACHGLMWSVGDLDFHWGSGDAPTSCPLETS